MDGLLSRRLWRDSGEDLWSSLSTYRISEQRKLVCEWGFIGFILLCFGLVRGSFLVD